MAGRTLPGAKGQSGRDTNVFQVVLVNLGHGVVDLPQGWVLGAGCGDVVRQDKFSVFPQDLPQILLSSMTHPAPLSLVRKVFQDLLKPVHRNPYCVCHEGKLCQDDRRHFSQYTRREMVRAFE